jgi:hypothetical protein
MRRREAHPRAGEWRAGTYGLSLALLREFSPRGSGRPSSRERTERESSSLLSGGGADYFRLLRFGFPCEPLNKENFASIRRCLIPTQRISSILQMLPKVCGAFFNANQRFEEVGTITMSIACWDGYSYVCR